MCGITGIYEFDTQAVVNERLLRRMTDLVAHRGPDDHGYFCQGSIGLGHRRLSIIDLSVNGHQPMSNAAGTVWISYNGECYNHADFIPQLKAKGYQFKSTSDTETLLHLYEEYGPDFLRLISGMFALAIWDANKQLLLLARDRLGIKPLYYYQDAKHLIFASELKALLADQHLAGELNYSALSEYLHLMSVPDPQAIIRGVRKLLPGHFLCVERGRVSERRYWEVPLDAPINTANFETACEQFENLFRQTVKAHLLADVPVGAFLSGGVDSSSVVAAISQQTRAATQTFACTFKGLPEFDESGPAHQVANLFQTSHTEFDVLPDLVNALPRIAWYADEPFAISSACGVYYLAQAARQHVSVVLTGDGADEVFAGYPWRHAAPASANLLRRARVAVANLRHGLMEKDRRYVRELCCDAPEDLAVLLMPDVRQFVTQAWDDNITQRYYDQTGQLDELTRKLYTDLKSTLVSEMLTKVDRMTMAFGLEARVPFLDHKLVEWAFQLPASFKLHGNEGKYIVKKSMERVLPKELLYRPKHGFNVPMKLWLRGPLREFVQDTLAEAVLRKRGLFHPPRVARLLQEHMAEKRDATGRIFTLLMLELWFQHFVDRRQELHAE